MEVKKNGIQMTLYDYFQDVDSFTLKDANECVKIARAEINAPVKEPSIRARIYEGIDKGLFKRVSKGVYTVNKKDSSCLLINGDGRDLSFIEDESIDCIITDHPYKIDKSLKGGNRDFAQYDSFQYTQKDFNEKARVMKQGCFVVEFFPEENSENYKYIYKCKEMAELAGLNYYTTVNWKKGSFVANTGRKAKNTEQILFFSKGKPKALKIDVKKEKAFYSSYKLIECNDDLAGNIRFYVKAEIYNDVESVINRLFLDYCSGSFDLLSDKYEYEYLETLKCDKYIELFLNEKSIDYYNATDKDVHFYMSGTNGILPTEFDVQPVKKSDKIHQAEKPVELIQQIISYITVPDDKSKILDQFAGSGVVGEAALKTNNDSILIEKNKDTYNVACNRVRGRSR